MAKELESTMKFKADISNLKAGIQDAKNIIASANAEFKLVTSTMGEWLSSADGLCAKISQLTSVLGAEETKLQMLKEQHALVAAKQGEHSTAAQRLQVQITNQEAAINKTKASLDYYSNALSDVQSGSREFESAMASLDTQLNAIDQSVRLANSEFNAATSGMEDWSAGAVGLTAKIQQLESVLDSERDKLEVLNKQYDLTVQNQGESSAAAEELKIKINEQQAVVNATEKELDKYGQALKDATDETKQMKEGVKQLASDLSDTLSPALNKLNESLNSLIKVGLATATAAIAGFGAAALRSGMDFEAGMSEVEAISGAVGQDLEDLNAIAKEMGETTKFTASQSAEALKYMAMAGWDAQQMVSGLPGVMYLAAAAGEDLGTVSDIVTDALTAFGMKAEESAHFADVLAAASSNSNTNVSMMGKTFQYVAPIAGAMGYSIEDTAAAIGMLANAGIKGTQAGTALRGILTRLVKPTEDSAEAMEALGISATNADGSLKPLSSLVDELRYAMGPAAIATGRLTEAEQAQYAAMLAGQNALSGFLALVNASDDDVQKLTASIDNCNGMARQMADIMNDNLKGKLTLLGSALEGLGIQIYEKLQEPLKNAIDAAITAVGQLSECLKSPEMQAALDKVGEAIGDFVEKLAELASDAIPKIVSALPKILDGLVWLIQNLPALVKLILSIKAAFIAWDVIKIISGVKDAIIKFTTATVLADGSIKASTASLIAQKAAQIAATAATKAAAAAQWLLNAALSANPIGLVIALIGGLTTAITVLWHTNEGFQKAVSPMWNDIKRSVSTSVDGMKASFKGLTDSIREMNPLVKKEMSQLSNTVNEGFENLVDLSVSRTLTSKIKETSWGIRTTVKSESSKYINVIKDTYEQEIALADKQLEWSKKHYNSRWEKVFAEGSRKYGEFGKSIKTSFDKMSEDIAVSLDSSSKSVQKFTDDINATANTGMPGFVSSIAGFFSEMRENISLHLSSSGADIGSLFSDIPNRIGHSLGLAAGNVVKFVGEAYTTVKTEMPKVVASVVNGFKEIPDKIGPPLEAFKATVKKSYDELPGLITKQLVSFRTAVVNFFNDMPGKIVPALNTLQQKIVDSFRSLKNKFMEIGQNIVQGLKDGITQSWENFKSAVKGLVDGFVKGFKDALGISSPSRVFAEIARNVVLGFMNTFKELPGLIVPHLVQIITDTTAWGDKLNKTGKDKVSSFKNGILGLIRPLPGEFFGVGENMAVGIGNGIANKANAIRKLVSKFVKGLVNQAKDDLDMHSPSRVWKGMGENSGESYGMGLIGSLNVVKKGLDRALDFGSAAVKPSGLSPAGNGANADGYGPRSVVINQNNYSPKALSRLEIYRQTKNAVMLAKGV